MTGLVVDTSALVAVVWKEPGRDWLVHTMEQADFRQICAPTVLELGMVLEGRTPAQVGVGHRAVRDFEVESVAFDAELQERAIEAWRRFGKGRHKAALNFGDCFTYALAERDQLPVLCTGNDFAATDLEVLRPPT